MPPLLALILARVPPGPPAPTAEPPPARCPEVPIRGDGSFDWPDASGAPVAERFDPPVGAPDGAGTWDAQPFGENRHLGADLNATDGDIYGDPVVAVADGCVVFAQDIWRGWGNVVRVVHVLPDGAVVESLYAHLDRIDTYVGAVVARGAPIGVVGDAHGAYGPHLHLEIRDQVGMPQGHGYGTSEGYVDPMAFLAAHGAGGR